MKGLISVCVVLTAFSLSGGQEAVTGGQETVAVAGGHQDVTGGQETVAVAGGQEAVTVAGGQQDVTGGQMHMAQAQAGLGGLNLKLEHPKPEPSR